jgi:hypothetical protein
MDINNYTNMSLPMTIFAFVIIGVVIFGAYKLFQKLGLFETPSTTPAYNCQTANSIAECMASLLTMLCGQICIYRPIDVYSVWHEPLQEGNKWTYRAKATMLPNALTDIGSLKDYATLLNRRASDIGMRIRVRSVTPQGLFFIYVVDIVG